MTRSLRILAALAVALAVGHGSAARAQWGYPGGYGGYGWGGWGGGASTVGGDMARGLGAYAAGAGYYNQQTAVARSINANTVLNWNQYMYEANCNAARNERLRTTRRLANANEAQSQIQKRLRDNPEPRDIYSGDALNVAMEEINDPRIYSKTLQAAQVKVGGESIRNIPFQYAAGAITTSIHQITQGGPPEALLDPAYDADRAAIRALRDKIKAEIDSGQSPDKDSVDKAIAAVNALEAKVDQALPRNDPKRVAADKYLKSVHGLLAMMQTPALDLLLAGVEKRPDATLAELLQFMNACNLRFGPAQSAQQRLIYDSLYPQLVSLRQQIAPALASAAPVKTQGNAPGEFFSGMNYEDLQKKAPPPPAPGR